MDNVEKLKHLGILGDVRQRLGASDINSIAYDFQISNMDNDTMIKQWCGWNLGDEGWWVKMKHLFDTLEDLDKTCG